MPKDNRRAPFVNIGSSSLLVVFLVLCLVTFATLSLSSALNDYSFSERSAERRKAYYSASGHAEEIVAAVDAALEAIYRNANSGAAADTTGADSGTAANTDSGAAIWALEQLTADTCPALADAGAELTIDVSGPEPLVSFAVPVNDQQALKVVLALTGTDSAEPEFYEIRTWQTISTEEWESDSTLSIKNPILTEE